MRSLRPRTRRARPVAVDDGHADRVAARKSAAIRLAGQGSLAADRIATAPAGYVLAHTSSDVARHCELLSPVPPPGQARVVITPARVPGEWHLDVGSHDRPGLLAAFTGVLARQGVDVHQAVLATWDDGAALQAFVISAAQPPEPGALQAAFERSLGEPLSSPPIPDAQVSFANGPSELYTSCDVRAADRPGLLHAIAVAIASAGADVHAARVTTVGGIAHDRFDLSSPAGLQLDASVEEAIRAGVTRGITFRRRGHRRERSVVHSPSLT
jgi:[protein-PII] uridylyltransferase